MQRLKLGGVIAAVSLAIAFVSSDLLARSTPSPSPTKKATPAKSSPAPATKTAAPTTKRAPVLGTNGPVGQKDKPTFGRGSDTPIPASEQKARPTLPRVAPVGASDVEKRHYLMSADLPPDIKKRHLATRTR